MEKVTASFNALTQPLKGRHSIEASAGTGKTYSITLLWLRLLIEDELSVDQILVSTFTKAATAELKDRLLAALRNALLVAQHLNQGGEITTSPEAQIIKASNFTKTANWNRLLLLLNEALSNFDLAPISTIHSFCQSLISRHSVELGCDSGLTLIQDHSEFLDTIVDDHIMHLTEHGAPEVTTLKKTAKILASHGNARLLSAHPIPPQELESLAQQILQAAPAALTATKAGSSRKAVSKVLEQFRSNRTWASFSDAALETLPSDFLSLWNRYGNTLNQEGLVSLGEFAKAVKRDFPTAKLNAGARSFDDIVLTVQIALETQGSNGPLAKSVRSRLRAAIIDECQDSDAMQISVFERLFCHPDTVSFIVIGDPKQSIYRFRGADLASYKRLATNAQAASPMTRNHRSDKPLVDSINNLYSHSYIFPDGLSSQTQTAYITVGAQHSSRIDDARNPSAMIFQWSEQTTRKAAQQELAELVASECSRLVKDGVTIEDRHSGEMRRLHFGDIAVLSYGHHELRLVRRALTQAGIPCQSSGASLGSVFESAEARDVLAWLQLLAAISLHGSVLSKLLAFEGTPLGCADTNTLLSVCQNPENQAERCAEFQREAEMLHRVGPLPAMLKRLDKTNVIASNLKFAEGERRYTNWRHIASLLQQEHARGRRGPAGLAQWLGRRIAGGTNSGAIAPRGDESTLMKLETDSAAVQMVTVHSSKGLEYPIVFCPFLWHLRSNQERRKNKLALFRTPQEWCIDVGSPAFEDHLSTGIEQEDEEEHRKLYVALTRARHRLYIGMAPVGEYRANQNGAARSPIAALPGLGLAGKDVSSWRTTLERIQGTALQVHQGNAAAPYQIDTAPDLVQARAMQPPPAHRAYPFPLKRTVSFTSISKSEHEHESAADRDIEKLNVRPQSVTSSDLLSDLGAAGAALGDRLHAVLEDYLGNRADMSDAIADCAPAAEWSAAIKTIVESPLTFGTHAPVSLAALREGCITEMQFHLPVSALNPQILSSVLLDTAEVRQDEKRAQWAANISKHWRFGEFAGHLQGYIDLIFEHEGHWFVLDYKSNRLDDYEPKTLEGAMVEKHYLLQARLYALALHRHLQVQIADYDYSKHFGGVAYLFVRGLPAGGLWFERPSLEGLERLGNPFSNTKP